MYNTITGHWKGNCFPVLNKLLMNAGQAGINGWKVITIKRKMMKIEIENGVRWLSGDGASEAFVTIINILCNAPTPDDFRKSLQLWDSKGSLSWHFKWGFGNSHFWLKQRTTPGKIKVNEKRVLIARF